MSDNNGSKSRQKISITIPNEELEILDAFCRYHFMCRSSAIAFLLAKGLFVESMETDGFSFDSPFCVQERYDGSSYVIKRKDVKESNSEWVFACGKNSQGKICTVSSEDFVDLKNLED